MRLPCGNLDQSKIHVVSFVKDMRLISVEKFSKAMQEYFIGLIEQHKTEVDIVDCNADLQKIIDKQSTANGWIPCTERYPDTDKYILISFSNFSVPCVGRYEEDEEGGAFYLGDELETCVSQDLFVNAWAYLPQCYSESE